MSAAQKTYTVAIAGLGKRGTHHAEAFAANPRFKIVGLCDIDAARAEDAKNKFGDAYASADADDMLAHSKPDIFCFCTLPAIRLPLVQAGVNAGVKLIAYEKPVATSTNEALEMTKLMRDAGVKSVVSHQHRYGDHYKKVKEIVASGAIGRVHTVYGTATGWAAHMLSHLIDYTCWFNDYQPCEWVIGQAAGRGKLADLHTSPDYITGMAHFKNGVRGVY